MSIPLDVPNLDDATLDPDVLAEFGRDLGRLAAYADCKALAMRARLAGKIVEALARERRCEMIYKMLPPSWRW